MLWEHEIVGSSPAIPTINLVFMKTKLRFFKKDKKWYADVPNHTLEENEMVADTALDLIADNKDEVILTLSDEDDKHSMLTMTIKEHDSEGAYYTISGFLYNKFLDLFD